MRSSVIELDHTKTCRSTLFNCTNRQQLATDFAGSPRTVSPDEQWCKLISARRTQFHVPHGTQTFQLPQSLQDIGAIVPRAQGRSFLKQQLDGILCRVVVTHDEPHKAPALRLMPSKQWKSTCMDSPLVTASMDCFQSWPQTIFHCSKQEATKSGIRSSQRCGCFNVVSSKWHLMWKTFSCWKYCAQSFGAPRISISFAHMVTATVTFTDRVLKMSSKLHAALMLPSNTDARSVGLQITAASNGHCSMALKL